MSLWIQLNCITYVFWNILKTLEGEKKDLMIRNASLASENKRLLAENKVLDKALK